MGIVHGQDGLVEWYGDRDSQDAWVHFKNLEWKKASATIYAANSHDILVAPRLIEPVQTLEFVLYQKGQRFATHHDFQLRDR